MIVDFRRCYAFLVLIAFAPGLQLAADGEQQEGESGQQWQQKGDVWSQQQLGHGRIGPGAVSHVKHGGRHGNGAAAARKEKDDGWTDGTSTDLHHGDVHITTTAHPNARTCSKKMGVTTDQEMCMSVTLRMKKISGEALVRELSRLDSGGSVDANFLIRRLHIVTPEADPMVINHALDAFLEPRPWWLIRRELITGLERFDTSIWSHNATAEDILHTDLNNHDKPGAYVGKLSHITLQRYEAKMEAHLHQVGAVQFPPASACASSRMKLSHTVNAGWGSASAFFGIFVGEYPWAVFAPWESNSNLATEGIMYASPEFCPSVVNKWTCAFIPATNCSFPKAVSGCKPGGGGGGAGGGGESCNWDGDLLYSQATEAGERVGGKDAKTDSKEFKDAAASATHAVSAYHKDIDAWYASHKNDDFVSQAPVVNREGKQLEHRAADKWLVMKVFGALWRPNFEYRTLISKRIKLMWKEMYERHGLPSLTAEENTPCTAIHIRRGDRSLNMEGQEMRDWCSQWLPFKSWDDCTSKTTGKKGACQGISDYGCFHANPFGALTLQDYLDAAWSIHKTRNVFVLTDAADWLRRERSRRPSNDTWAIYSIASDGSKDRASDTPRATLNGVEYHASVRMAQSCQALVGHWGSGVTHMVRNAMCFRHGNPPVLGVCPPTVDMQM